MMTDKFGKYINIIIKIIALFSMIIGLLFSLILIYKNLFNQYQVTEPEIYIAAFLILAGLLGSVFDVVLKKAIEDFFVKYSIDDRISNIVENKLNLKIPEQIASSKTQEEEEKVEDLYTKNKFIDNKNNNIETKTENINVNTVIVPVNKTFEDIKKYNKYICPSDYSFRKNLQYIAFYKDKEIKGYGKLKKVYNDNMNDYKIFEFEKFYPLEIPHIKKGPYIQGKKYCTFDSLIKANTTDDIEP